MIVADKEGRVLGVIVFFWNSPGETGYEIGYVIFRRADRGKGYLTEALQIFSAYLFDLKPIPRLQILTAKDNVPARRVAEKCGHVLEGTFRRYGFVRGAYCDAILYTLLREDCPPLAHVPATESA